MAKVRVQYVCANCGHITPRWVGRCPECGEWNTLQEESVGVVQRSPKRGGGQTTVKPLLAQPITALPEETETHLPTGLEEFDRVLGGGIVRGALVLIGGEPGVGKSTLMLQIAHRFAQHGTVLYITGEESIRQLRLRARRLQAEHPNLKVAAENELESILALLESEQPLAAIIDSIQTLSTPAIEAVPGTVSQIRTCASALQQLAKAHEITLFLIGHATKEGAIAGSKVLEHLMDTVLYFEGEPQGAFRILRATKNRFGATDEIGVFDLRAEGLVPVPNPSERLLAERAADAPSSVVFSALEGSRALLMEIQALTTPSFLNTPRRVIIPIALSKFTNCCACRIPPLPP
jgi:DNA repair protein RadA/Sms